MTDELSLVNAAICSLTMRVVVAAVVLVASLASPDASAVIHQNPIARLRTWEVGDGRTPLVLLHGYGSSPQEWLQFTQTIRLAPAQRFVFPEAPEVTRPPDGPIGGRAWWRLDLASYRAADTGLPDLSRAHPAGLDRSVDAIRQLTSDLYRRLGYRQRDLVLGGFSQGAMIAAGVAFRTDQPLRALVLLSGTPVDEAALVASLRARRGLRVFVAHGRRDDALPFEGSRRLQEAMRGAGLDVTWVPFDGGHEIPAEVVVALNAFLSR